MGTSLGQRGGLGLGSNFREGPRLDPDIWEGHSWQKVDFSSSFVYKSSCSWWEFE